MIRHTGTYRDNQARYIRNGNKRSQDYFMPDQLPGRDHHGDEQVLVPVMKKTLKFTARATWFMMKTLVRAAFQIPRLFSKTSLRPQRKKNPSPASAFPAP